MLKVGDKLPKFKLQNDEGDWVSEKDLLGLKKKILIYFYPKDDTPGCTNEACGFRDFRYELQDAGVEVIGISKDSVASHQKFKKKYKLNFMLLSDGSTETIAAFGAWQEKSMYGKGTLMSKTKKYIGVERISYLFDEKGKVMQVYGKVSTKEQEHVKQVLGGLK